MDKNQISRGTRLQVGFSWKIIWSGLLGLQAQGGLSEPVFLSAAAPDPDSEPPFVSAPLSSFFSHKGPPNYCPNL